MIPRAPSVVYLANTILTFKYAEAEPHYQFYTLRGERELIERRPVHLDGIGARQMNGNLGTSIKR